MKCSISRWGSARSRSATGAAATRYWSTRKLLTSSVPTSIAIRIPTASWSISTARRFVDEGEDFFSYTYAKCGREVLRLPWRTAYQIFDSKTRPLLRSEYNRGFHVSADTH